MDNYLHNPLYRKVNESFTLLKKSIQNFNKSLQERNFFELQRVYYFARGCRKAGEEYYQKALSEARTLTKLRKNLLEKSRIIVKSLSFQDVGIEIIEDEAIGNWMTKEEIIFFLRKYFEEQRKGKRKLCNIKLRLILGKLEDLLSKTRKLEEDAKRYYISRMS